MAEMTTIAISVETKVALEAWKVHPRETYDDVIVRLLKGVTKFNKVHPE